MARRMRKESKSWKKHSTQNNINETCMSNAYIFILMLLSYNLYYVTLTMAKERDNYIYNYCM